MSDDHLEAPILKAVREAWNRRADVANISERTLHEIAHEAEESLPAEGRGPTVLRICLEEARRIAHKQLNPYE